MKLAKHFNTFCNRRNTCNDTVAQMIDYFKIDLYFKLHFSVKTSKVLADTCDVVITVIT